jgi:hypothetical protein
MVWIRNWCRWARVSQRLRHQPPTEGKDSAMHSRTDRLLGLIILVGTILSLSGVEPALAADKKPNILVIMGDDVGWFNIGAYSPVMKFARPAVQLASA